MMWFALIPTALVGGFLLWAWRRIAVVPQWGHRWVPVVVGLVFALAFAAVFAGFDAYGGQFSPATMRPWVWVGMLFLPFCLYLFLGLLLGWLAAVVVYVVRWRSDTGVAARRRLSRFVAPLAVVTAAAVTAYGVVRAADPVVTEHTVTVAGLPAALDGMRVAVITDLHAGAVRSAAFTRLVVDRTNAARPDLIVIVGDLVDGTAARYAPEIAPLADLRAPLGVFATTGNHEMFRDTQGWLQAFEGLGLRVLRNESVRVRRGGAEFVLAGVHDLSGQGLFASDPQAALAGVRSQETVLYLAHQPKQAFAVAGRGVDLQLSGHTHGGQVWPGSLIVPLQQPVVSGYAMLGGVPTFTSRGAGAWGPPVRVGADPEVPVLTLRAS